MDEMFFDKIKSTAYKAKDNAGKWAKEAAKRTSNALTHAKLAYASNEANNHVNDIYAEIGRTIYADYLDGKEADEKLRPALEQLDKLMEEIDIINTKIAELKDSLKCPECGAYNKNDADFCSKCGSPLDEAGEVILDDDIDKAEEAAEVEDDEEDVIIINPKKPE